LGLPDNIEGGLELLKERPLAPQLAKCLPGDTDCVELISELNLVERLPVDSGDFPAHPRS
jgi:hypothetical protein